MSLSKPKFGHPCNHCGLCCRESLCGVGEIVFGEIDGPCPALLEEGDKYLCGIMVHEAENFPIGQRLVAHTLGAGTGCSMPDEDTTADDLMHFNIFSKMKTHKVNPIDRSYTSSPSLTIMTTTELQRLMPLSELKPTEKSIRVLPFGYVLLSPTETERQLCDLFARAIQRICPTPPHLIGVANNLPRTNEDGTPSDETKGVRIARENRAACNNLTNEQREALLARAMQMIEPEVNAPE